MPQEHSGRARLQGRTAGSTSGVLRQGLPKVLATSHGSTPRYGNKKSITLISLCLTKPAFAGRANIEFEPSSFVCSTIPSSSLPNRSFGNGTVRLQIRTCLDSYNWVCSSASRRRNGKTARVRERFCKRGRDISAAKFRQSPTFSSASPTSLPRRCCPSQARSES